MAAAMHARAVETGVAGHVEFAGKIEDVEARLARTKTFVLTSRTEGLSIAMSEAMAAGVVPVVADVGELGDLVRSGVNGFLVPPGRITEFAERIVTLLSDRSLWSRASAAAVKSVLDYNGKEAVAARWRETLQNLSVSGGNTPLTSNAPETDE